MPGIEQLSLAGGLGKADTELLQKIREKGARYRSPPAKKMKRPTLNPTFLKRSAPPPGIRSPLAGRSPVSTPRVKVPTPPGTPTKQIATFTFATPVVHREAKMRQDDEKSEPRRTVPLVPRIYPQQTYRPVIHDFSSIPKFTRAPDIFRDLRTEKWHLDRAIRFGLVGGQVDMSWRGRKRKRSSESALNNQHK